MTAIEVARKDLLDVRRAKMVWFVLGMFGLIVTAMFYWTRDAPGEPISPMEEALGGILFFGALLIPLVTLVAAYLAIAGERDSGSIKYLLSLAGSRGEIIIGKYLSRTVIICGGVTLAFLWGLVLAGIFHGSIESGDPGIFVGVVALTLLYVAVYIAVAVGISAMAASRSQAMGGSIGFYMVTVVFPLTGLSIPQFFDWLLNSQLNLAISENIIDFMASLTAPTIAFLSASELVFSAENPEVPPAPDVWYLQPEMMIVILLVWIIAPLGVGYWRFQRADIG